VAAEYSFAVSLTKLPAWMTAREALAAALVGVAMCAAGGTARPSSEAVVALRGARLLVAAGQIHDPDAPELEGAMRAEYEKMRADEESASPSVRLRASPLAAGDVPDLLVYEPAGAAPGAPRAAIVFLHGYGGRFALPCWQIASAAASAGATTVCPSIGTDGAWWTPDGGAVVDQTVAALRRAGYARIVLAGLSNGAIGASRLAPRRKGMFAGLIAISGADPAAASPGVPALVVQGRQDAMASAGSSRAYARRAGAKYVDVDAGHFAMLTRDAEVDRAVHDFVASLQP
jgi:pimeloyl-ACP methyl ester carboxylesterase